MDTVINVLIVVGVIVLLPACIGVLWVMCFGVPIYGCMKLWEIFTIFVINPIFNVINKVPILGRFFTSFASIVIGITLSALIFALFEFPLIMFIVKAMGN